MLLISPLIFHFPPTCTHLPSLFLLKFLLWWLLIIHFWHQPFSEVSQLYFQLSTEIQLKPPNLKQAIPLPLYPCLFFFSMSTLWAQCLHTLHSQCCIKNKTTTTKPSTHPWFIPSFNSPIDPLQPGSHQTTSIILTFCRIIPTWQQLPAVSFSSFHKWMIASLCQYDMRLPPCLSPSNSTYYFSIKYFAHLFLKCWWSVYLLFSWQNILYKVKFNEVH